MAITFPLELAKKAAFNDTIVPKWDITVQKTASGRRRSLVTQSAPAYTFSYTFPALNGEEYGKLLGFYNARKGSFEPFFFSDYTASTTQNQVLSRGTDGKYQLYAPIGDYVEPVYHATDIEVFVDGAKITDFTHNGGKLSVAGTNASSRVTANYRYYWRVVFADSINITELFYNVYRITVKLEVAR